MKIDKHHPRFWSLYFRERLANALAVGIIVPQGLIAHGRGEAFDYILGEKSSHATTRATSAAAALLLSAQHPVISVNGNTAALVGKGIVKLAITLDAPIEVNLFHRTRRRELIIARYLKRLGATQILGVGNLSKMKIPGIYSQRRFADRSGIGEADVILVPLEDGDRTEALRRAGKGVIAIDLNPLSRTSRAATVSIVDNVIRAVPTLTETLQIMRKTTQSRLARICHEFDNKKNLADSIQEMISFLAKWVKK